MRRSLVWGTIGAGPAALALQGAQRAAYADNCGSLGDCYGTITAAGTVAVAIAVAVAIVAVAVPVIVEAAAGLVGEYLAVRTRAQRDPGAQEIHLATQEIQHGTGILKGPDVRLRFSGDRGNQDIEAPDDLLATEEGNDRV